MQESLTGRIDNGLNNMGDDKNAGANRHGAWSAVCFVTLGCKVNQAESEAMAQLFRHAGYAVVDSSAAADVVVVNTCTVTNTGGSKSRQAIRRMIKAHPDSLVVVMGCYAQTAPGDVLDIPGVDLVLGTQDRTQVLDWIERVKQERKPQSAVRDIWQATEFEELPLLEGESRMRAVLKIQEGCNKFCTYCIIPYARGPVRSRRPENALAEARRLVEAGYREIVLTGIHTGSYGEDLPGNWDLARLVRELSGMAGLRRLRLSSIEPMEFTPGLVETIVASPVVCPHLHIPLQSGSDAVLARMQRPYILSEYRSLLTELKAKIPDLAVTTDIITGFPGETASDHQNALDFARACGFAGMHVFPFSRREGTPAAAYPGQVPNKVKEVRVKEMITVAQESQREFVRRFFGRSMDILVEQVTDQGTARGHTANYIEVEMPAPENGGAWQAGQFATIVLREEYLRNTGDRRQETGVRGDRSQESVGVRRQKTGGVRRQKTGGDWSTRNQERECPVR